MTRPVIPVHGAGPDELPADLIFLALKDKALLLPTDERIHPATVALVRHRRHVFDKAG